MTHESFFDNFDFLLFKKEEVHFFSLKDIDIVGIDRDIIKGIFALIIVNQKYLFSEETTDFSDLLLTILLYDFGWLLAYNCIHKFVNLKG